MPPPGRTVLVVDDNEIHRYALARTVEKLGFRVLEAAEGKTALETALRERPDLVLLDIHLPGLTGFEICRLLKSEPATTKCAVVFHTAMDTAGGAAYALEVGAAAFLTYPIDETHLKSVLEGVLAKRAAATQERAANAGA